MKKSAQPRAADLAGLLRASQPFRDLLAALERADPPPALGGLVGSLFSLVAAALLAERRRFVLVLVPGEDEADGVAADLALFGAGDIPVLPPGETEALRRARVLGRLRAADAPRALVVPAGMAAEPLPPPEALERRRLPLKVGARLERDALVSQLAGAHFERQDVVDRPGAFSVHGDVLDVFPFEDERPLRIELLDDEIEGLRRFDPATQLSVEVLKEASLSLFRPDDLAGESTLAAYLPADALVLSRDATAMSEALDRHLALFSGEERERREDAWSELRRRRELPTSRLKLPSGEAVNFGGQVVAPEGTAFESAVRTLERVSRGKAATVVYFDTAPEKERFQKILEEEGARIEGAGDWRARPISFAEGSVHQGFHSPFLGIAAVDHHELFAVVHKRRPLHEEPSVLSRAIESFLELREGDYVVHLAHGIARFEGLERMEKGGAAQDFLALRFHDETRLLVPASKIDLVQKYVGGKGEAPELSKLGSGHWQRRKEAVAAAVTDLAAELLEVQALRAKVTGIAHPADTPWQQEFEAAFPFQATPDQARAVEEIKRDMESARPMDRLVCGDVGYGKTEVAMRAAFKCVMGQRQVAVLVPTTILAQQHWDSFRERMKDYPVVVESLSRFRTAKEQADVVARVKAGAVDILIGTHRMVQGDVEFKDLGLLVIDEEQRFGVVDKEKLRKLRRNVDVLTMTATPIPRTLNMAMVGLRDISSLSQAPGGRRDVHTEVVRFDPALIRRAILREMDRGGQVFVVHNRVHSIGKLAKKLQDLVPEARFLIGHGQMAERALERTMLAFLQHEADVLVATTIIESGLDIPSANTIFVDDADAYGLADLHQLRGRVGRYHHQAFAYFLVRDDRVLTEIAEKRLRAIEEFARLGAGFQIAMRDLEIRGAGNMLGAEQSGHIASVGYEMYCRLLDMAVRRLKRQEVVMPEEVEINVDFTAFLPEGYIPDKRLRIELYRKLGRAIFEEQFRDVVKEMRDRFGPPPPVAEEFVLVAKIRALMERNRVALLEIMPREGVALRSRRLKALQARVVLPPDEVRTLQGTTLLLVRPEPFRGPGELLAFLERALPDRGAARHAANRSDA